MGADDEILLWLAATQGNQVDVDSGTQYTSPGITVLLEMSFTGLLPDFLGGFDSGDELGGFDLGGAVGFVNHVILFV